MDADILKLWDAGQAKLKERLSDMDHGSIDCYLDLLKLTLETIDFELHDGGIQSIDYGDYQGTLIFVWAEATYQPTTHSTFYTSVEYGSCSGCDTLQRILEIGYDEKFTESQVDDLWTLCLHMMQCTKKISQED
ncbi:MAG: hypothetical protein LBK62_04910 [Treponema sp.]|jgi:hypothetical protein|nr:hypothetical protein [Treponema sp.]